MFQFDNIVELSRKDLRDVIAENKPSWAADIGPAAWFESGGRLFALLYNGEYVSFGWAIRRKCFEVYEISGTVAVNEETLWIWNCFTPAEYRGRGFYPALIIGIRKACQLPPTIIYCMAGNHSSRRGIEKAGYRPAFSVTKHRLFVVRRQRIRGLYGGYQSASKDTATHVSD